MTRAFDREAIDLLLLLDDFFVHDRLHLTPDAVLKFAGLITAGLVATTNWFRSEEALKGGPDRLTMNLVLLQPSLTEKGRLLVDAWKRGDREAVKAALSLPAARDGQD